MKKPKRKYEEVIKVCHVGGKMEVAKTIVEEIGWRNDYQDNGFCQGKLTLENFDNAIEKARKNKTNIFFAHDYKPLYRIEELLELFEIVICPVHDIRIIKQVEKTFDWFGYDSIRDRNYTYSMYREKTKNKLRWYMGWKRLDDLSINQFDGFDTTLPSRLSSFGKIINYDGEIITLPFKKKTREMILSSFYNLNFYLRSIWTNGYPSDDYSLKKFYPYLEPRKVGEEEK